MQNRFRRPRGDPPRRGHKCALRPPNAVICYESATFANWKTRAQKSDKNEKTFSKKWVWRQLHTLGTSGAASLKKGCLAHSKNQCFCKVSTTLQRETRCAWIWCKLQRFRKICRKKKKSKKGTSNKKHMFYCSRCKSGHFSWEGCYKIRGHQNHNNKKATLRAHGFACVWWQWTPKSEHSYTKREAASVQGAQQ